MLQRNQILAGFGFVATLFSAIFLIHPASSSITSLVSIADGMIQNSSAMIVDPFIDFPIDSYHNVVGIDLGATHSRVAVSSETQNTMLINEHGKNSTPSYVAFTEEGVLVGQEAEDHALKDPMNTIADIRRFIGCSYSEIADIIKDIPNIVVEKNGKPHFVVQLNGKDMILAPEEIAAQIFANLKTIAEGYFGSEVTHAVITVPAYFNDNQRTGIKDAARIGGLNVLRTVNEPTAAAITYGLDRQDGEALFLVFNTEMGHSDLTLEYIDSGIYEILAMESTKQLGGSILDQVLVKQVADALDLLTNLNIREEPRFLEGLNELSDIEKALSTTPSITINIEGYPITITSDQLRKLHASLLSDNILPMITRLLKEGNETMEAIHLIILTGDLSHTSKIQPFFEQVFPGKKIVDGILTNEAFVFGAARQAWVLSGDDGVDCASWMQINPLSFGFESSGGIMEKIIPRNTVIPTRKMKLYTTARDNQEKIEVKIFQGERMMTNKNMQLGVLELPLFPAPKGVAQVEVSFELDANEILKVTVRDKTTGYEISEVLFESQGLQQDKIDQHIMDAEKNAEEDLAAKEGALEQLKNGEGDEFGIVPVVVAEIPPQWTPEPSWFCSVVPESWCRFWLNMSIIDVYHNVW